MRSTMFKTVLGIAGAACLLAAPAAMAGGGGGGGCSGPWLDFGEQGWVPISESHFNSCADTDHDGEDGPGEDMVLSGEHHVNKKFRLCDDGVELNFHVNHGKVFAHGQETGNEYNSNGIFNLRAHAAVGQTWNQVLICHFVESGKDGKDDYLFHLNNQYRLDGIDEATGWPILVETHRNEFTKCPGQGADKKSKYCTADDEGNCLEEAADES